MIIIVCFRFAGQKDGYVYINQKAAHMIYDYLKSVLEKKKWNNNLFVYLFWNTIILIARRTGGKRNEDKILGYFSFIT